MQREDVERLIGKLMEAEERPEVIYQDEDKYHLPADAAEALRTLLDRAEKAEAEVIRLAASDTVALFNAAAGATTAIAHALDDGDVRDSSSGQLEASLNALNDALARPSAPETMAWAVVGQDGKVLRLDWIFDDDARAKRLKDAHYRVARVAIRVVEGVE